MAKLPFQNLEGITNPHFGIIIVFVSTRKRAPKTMRQTLSGKDFVTVIFSIE